MSDTLTTPDYAAIKQRQQAAWSSGDYSRIGVTLQIVGETLAEALDLPAGATALDVAAGNGNATLALARRGADVVSTDYVELLLDRGRARAKVEALPAVFQEADAEALPFADGAFDAVVSTFGVMFAPDQETAAAELVRVCREGGRVGLANWTPDSFIGEVFRLIGRYVPPPAGVKPPSRWGDRTWIERTFGPAASSLSLEIRQFVFRYASPQEGLDEFRTFYGPILKAFAALDADGQGALERDFLALIDRFNTSIDGAMRVPSDYAEIVITKA
jgi:ubiquinone/menaquinone biosynthesis C-methylase UbiE